MLGPIQVSWEYRHCNQGEGTLAAREELSVPGGRLRDSKGKVACRSRRGILMDSKDVSPFEGR